MTERRCPSCGGLVAEDAEWCGQCLARLDRPPSEAVAGPEIPEEPAALPGPAGPPVPPGPEPSGNGPAGPAPEEPGLRARGQEVVWTCPTCGGENPVDDPVCRSCGTPFRELFTEPVTRVMPAPGRALGLSLLFPGAGHMAAGRVAEGVARAVVFGFALGASLTIVLSRQGLGLGPFLALVGVLGLAAVLLYALTATDAVRVVRGDPQLVTTRMLLYGATGLILLTVTVLVLVGIRAGPGG